MPLAQVGQRGQPDNRSESAASKPSAGKLRMPQGRTRVSSTLPAPSNNDARKLLVPQSMPIDRGTTSALSLAAFAQSQVFTRIGNDVLHGTTRCLWLAAADRFKHFLMQGQGVVEVFGGASRKYKKRIERTFHDREQGDHELVVRGFQHGFVEGQIGFGPFVQ